MTQLESILEYLKSHDGITTLESCDRLRIFRLSERIRELENKGYSFSHTPEITQSGARVIRYRLTNTGESRELPAVSSARRAMKAEERDEPTIYGDEPRRLAASLPLAQDVTAHSNAVSSPPNDVLRIDGWDYQGRPMVRYVEGFGPGWPPDQDHLHRGSR